MDWWTSSFSPSSRMQPRNPSRARTPLAFSATQAAAENAAGKLDDLGRLERELRQDEITTELLDVVTGAEVVISAR